jgi:hypothetical protein
VAIDVAGFSAAWSLETEGMKQQGRPILTRTPNQEKIYRSDFYDDMVAGVDRVMSMGALRGAPVVIGKGVYFGSADEMFMR